jgi:hypothetical protein
MATARLDLKIDVFEKTAQRALVAPDLKPPDLVTAILREFGELEYLGSAPENYHLSGVDGKPLDPGARLGDQARTGDRLVLVEEEPPFPEGTRPASRPVYLREQSTGNAYRLAWLPAIIGRVAEDRPDNAAVAVDLTGFPTGLRVSRRHVRLSEDRGIFYVENLSSNPVSLIPAGGTDTEGGIPVVDVRRPFASGDMLRLDRSGIILKFVARREPVAEAGPVASAAAEPGTRAAAVDGAETSIISPK